MSRFLIFVCLFAAFAAAQQREPSKGIKIISAAYRPGSLVVNADVSRDGPGARIELHTKEKPLRARGAGLRLVSDDRYELIVEPLTAGGNTANPAPNPTPGDYRHIEIIVDFSDRMGKSNPAN